jgi:hypothetical protein
MKAPGENKWAVQDSWIPILVTLLPLWLFSIAILTEGFPNPPVLFAMALVAFVLALTIGTALVWTGWLKLDLILYSLFPLVLIYVFDEISTGYKTPFILACAVFLSVAMVGAQRSNSEKARWRIW